MACRQKSSRRIGECCRVPSGNTKLPMSNAVELFGRDCLGCPVAIQQGDRRADEATPVRRRLALPGTAPSPRAFVGAVATRRASFLSCPSAPARATGLGVAGRRCRNGGSGALSRTSIAISIPGSPCRSGRRRRSVTHAFRGPVPRRDRTAPSRVPAAPPDRACSAPAGRAAHEAGRSRAQRGIPDPGSLHHRVQAHRRRDTAPLAPRGSRRRGPCRSRAVGSVSEAPPSEHGNRQTDRLKSCRPA